MVTDTIASVERAEVEVEATALWLLRHWLTDALKGSLLHTCSVRKEPHNMTILSQMFNKHRQLNSLQCFFAVNVKTKGRYVIGRGTERWTDMFSVTDILKSSIAMLACVFGKYLFCQFYS